jgi:hypothetical protein
MGAIFKQLKEYKRKTKIDKGNMVLGVASPKSYFIEHW